MKITKQARRDAKQLFRGCCKNGVLDEDRARQFVGKVAEIKPRGYIAILTQFHRLVKLELERRTAHVESATPLAPELQASLKSGLDRIYGQGLNLQFDQKPSLIGGLRIQVGSDVYDGSVQARLAALQEGFQSQFNPESNRSRKSAKPGSPETNFKHPLRT